MEEVSLPVRFVESLRALFEVMDENGTGYISLHDVEGQWRREGVLSGDIVSALRKVSPPSGQLTFERFLAGMRIALLRAKSSSRRHSSDVEDRRQDLPQPDLVSEAVKMNSYNMLTSRESDVSHARFELSTAEHGSVRNLQLRPAGGLLHAPQTATVKPNNAMLVGERAIMVKTTSMPHLASSEDRHSPREFQQHPPTFNANEMHKTYQSTLFAPRPTYPNAGETIEDDSRRPPRRRESRRHTLSNGIDQTMLKRLRQLENEREILLDGMKAVEMARKWFENELSSVRDKIRDLGTNNITDVSFTEAYQEKLNFKTARIAEAKQQLATLVESSNKGFPLHVNLAVSQAVSPYGKGNFLPVDGQGQGQTDRTTQELKNHVAMLKRQNRQLTQEVSDKSTSIFKLEGEKSALIKRLFETKSRNVGHLRSYYDDTTLHQ